MKTYENLRNVYNLQRQMISETKFKVSPMDHTIINWCIRLFIGSLSSVFAQTYVSPVLQLDKSIQQ